MRVAFLWNRFSGFHNACLKELMTREGSDLFVCHEAGGKQAPYDEAQFEWIKKRISWREPAELSTLLHDLEGFRPEILIFASWNKPAYRAAAKSFAGRAFRVMGMDNCWFGTMKQRIGTFVAPFYVRPLADAVWLPGERQAEFARRLGFEPKYIMRGSLTCDQKPIAETYLKRLAEKRSLPRVFSYIGRFSPEKGLDTLAKAYTKYRAMSSDPWELMCCGAGPMQSLLDGQPGIRVEGFIQPRDLPEKLASSGCLVLPSHSEAWGLVVHEATSAGLPVIVSDRVGASVHLVQPGYNGFIFKTGDVDDLASLMLRISGMSAGRLDAMSKASYSLSQQYSPVLWVNTLFESYEFLFARTKRG